ncbi:MAG: 3-ketoacyl-ACP reductase [Betaproteobacteria bacterium]|nr:MAG: 3-ketoacyl-ACP reductase [Betaproteobacteria bacterium]
MPEQRPVALVTGGRRGIGRGIAWELARNGFDIVVNDLVQDSAVDDTLAGITARGGRACFVRGDIAAVEDHAALVDAAWTALGPFTCVVNNAGVQTRFRGDLLDTPLESYDWVNDTNARGTFFLTQRVARRMLAIPAPAWTRSIIFISSISAVYAAPTQAEYCISKAAVSMTAKLFTLRLAPHAISVYEVRPGFVRTDMTAHATDDKDARIARGDVPTARWGEPEDVGRAVAVVASGLIPYATGSALFVDGGFNVKRF